MSWPTAVRSTPMVAPFFSMFFEVGRRHQIDVLLTDRRHALTVAVTLSGTGLSVFSRI
ncbi:hypothetical protein [Mycolicibacterium phocaicum]|uniref:hypothetical protein n=1 Tax=Mycolicibacterium phocaicum TaxID=319706 RepID=UPI001F2792F7|nr:hypothetical protein [Mycolicibacterium phocaicum]